MATVFEMPKLGMDMEEGTVLKWFKQEGETVKKGEAFAEIETDKSSVEVEAPADGTVLKLYIPEGETKPCGTPIAVIGAAGETLPSVGGEAPAASAAAPAAAAPAAAPAPIDTNLFFEMPKLGMDMEEGTVLKWLKKEGEAVEKGQPLAEIETDKSSVEVESPLSGIVLKIYLPEGEPAPCGTPIAAIGAAGTVVPESLTAAAAPAQPAAPAPAAAPAPVKAPVPAKAAARPAAPVAALTPGGRIRSTPRARKLAEKNGVDIAYIKGSGSYGRILEQDVIDFIESGVAFAPAETPRRVPTDTVKPLTGVRKITARRMHQSLSNTAQTNHKVDVNMSNLINFRKQVNSRLEASGKKVSIVDILVKACALALMEYPQANASLREDGLHTFNYVNIGIAADTPKGLVVPVLKDADVLSLTEISEASKALIGKARQGALKPDDMSGGTFTISNLGMFEVDSFTAVLNPPETCILAVGRTIDKVVVEEGQMVIRPMMNLCLTYDHQVIDGADAARLLQTIKHYIENPVWTLM